MPKDDDEAENESGEESEAEVTAAGKENDAELEVPHRGALHPLLEHLLLTRCWRARSRAAHPTHRPPSQPSVRIRTCHARRTPRCPT